MQKRPVRRADASSTTVQDIQAWQVKVAQPLPAVPVLPETILLLDLEIQERTPDLGAMTRLVLTDVGATVQIFRLYAQHFGGSVSTPRRVEDCIAAIGVTACMDAIAAYPVMHDEHYRSIVETWAHAHDIAHYARIAAEDTPDVNPDEACMIGLLHAVALLPSALGWESGRKPFDAAHTGMQMARAWGLPVAVIDYFREIHERTEDTPWPEIVHHAHRLASRSSILCPLEQGARPLLYRAV